MCLGIPGKITEVFERDALRMAKVDYGGVVKEACLTYEPEAQVGEYILVHVGFAISRMSEAEAQETLRLIGELAQFDDQEAAA
jgi:hydrogenase expression/formation protein HypC